MKQNRVCIK